MFAVLVLTITLFFAVMVIPMQKKAFDQIMFTQAETVSRSIVQASSDALISKDYGFIVEHNVEVLKDNASIYYVLISPKKSTKIFITQKSWHMLDHLDEELQALEGEHINHNILTYDIFSHVYHSILRTVC
ncbi:MAG: hypothetical protein K9L60_14705 [Methylovulum sp.]|nr:hypothetical protein [Methylovulum sp.]MCF8000223.1 hypothetical protein [Methylovulum sp.]